MCGCRRCSRWCKSYPSDADIHTRTENYKHGGWGCWTIKWWPRQPFGQQFGVGVEDAPSGQPHIIEYWLAHRLCASRLWHSAVASAVRACARRIGDSGRHTARCFATLASVATEAHSRPMLRGTHGQQAVAKMLEHAWACMGMHEHAWACMPTGCTIFVHTRIVDDRYSIFGPSSEPRY